MKIPLSIRQLYSSKVELYQDLKNDTDTFVIHNKENKWHYESRVKSEESFAQKIETGRYSDPENLEDFFACTIVVENLTAIKSAVIFLENHYEINYRRPLSDDFTHKNPDSFVFDDLRLYVKKKSNPSLPSKDINKLLFEVQIKTFLQHAWSIATHDLIYKSDDINWTKIRIAHQIKAMLEHAEASISSVTELANNPILIKTNKKIDSKIKYLDFIRSYWQPSQLPSDVGRFADNLQNLLISLKLSLNDLDTYLNNENTLGKGIHTLNLSPYLIIVQTIFNQNPSSIHNFLNKNNQKSKLLLTKELQFPSGFTTKKYNNSINIGF